MTSTDGRKSKLAALRGKMAKTRKSAARAFARGDTALAASLSKAVLKLSAEIFLLLQQQEGAE